MTTNEPDKIAFTGPMAHVRAALHESRKMVEDANQVEVKPTAELVDDSWVERCAESILRSGVGHLGWVHAVALVSSIIRKHAQPDPRIAQIQAALERCNKKISDGTETQATACAICVFDIEQILQ